MNPKKKAEPLILRFLTLYFDFLIFFQTNFITVMQNSIILISDFSCIFPLKNSRAEAKTEETCHLLLQIQNIVSQMAVWQSPRQLIIFYRLNTARIYT